METGTRTYGGRYCPYFVGTGLVIGLGHVWRAEILRTGLNILFRKLLTLNSLQKTSKWRKWQNIQFSYLLTWKYSPEYICVKKEICTDEYMRAHILILTHVLYISFCMLLISKCIYNFSNCMIRCIWCSNYPFWYSILFYLARLSDFTFINTWLLAQLHICISNSTYKRRVVYYV